MLADKTLVGAFLALALSGTAQATTLNVALDGNWNAFDVDSLIAQSFGTEWIDAITGVPGYTGDGSSLSFTFTVPYQARLDIVDAGLAGDTYNYSITGTSSLSGTTSAVPATAYATALNVGTSYDAAFANPADFSFASVMLAAGTYTVSGSLAQSVSLNGFALDATTGALRVSAVPLPAAVWLLAPTLGVIGGLRRRQS